MIFIAALVGEHDKTYNYMETIWAKNVSLQKHFGRVLFFHITKWAYYDKRSAYCSSMSASTHECYWYSIDENKFGHPNKDGFETVMGITFSKLQENLLYGEKQALSSPSTCKLKVSTYAFNFKKHIAALNLYMTNTSFSRTPLPTSRLVWLSSFY